MTGTPLLDHYEWEGGREAMLRFGPAHGPLVLVAPALFEEANRTRAFTVAILRLLAARGIASALPDLPGQGESSIPTSEARLKHWREAFAAAAARLGEERSVDGIVAIRGGALVDLFALVPRRWHLSPMSGGDVLDAFRRVARAAGAMRFEPRDMIGDGGDPPVEIAGNLVSPNLLAELCDVQSFHARDGSSVRTVRMESDPRDADRKVAGAPLWRRSEPTVDPVLARGLADDIAKWVAACDG